MTITVGLIVNYTLSEHNAELINKRRQDTEAWLHGNTAHHGEVYPMLIVRVWNQDPGTVNGQVFLDGNDSLWVTSVARAETAANDGCRWSWPERV